MQKGQPLAYLSKALSEKNKHLSIYDKEFLALIMAVERWRSYLQYQEFVILTDHQSLCYLESQQLQSDLQRKAMSKLMGLQFRIVYRKGRENLAADALSRMGSVLSLQTVSEVQPMWLQEILNSYMTDPVAQQLLAQLAVSSPNEEGFSIHQGLIKKGNQLWVGHNSALRTKLISVLHDSALGGHSGIMATYQRVKKAFYWQGLKRDVEDFVKQCCICQKAKSEHVHPAGLLQPLPIPTGIWQDISMDFIEGLPKSDGYSVILVVVDRLSKYAHFFPLKHPFTAGQVAQVVFDNICKLHGLPKSIVSNRDKVFTSTFWKQLFTLMQTKLLLSTAYHPQSDGQTERVNQCLEMYLRCATHDSPTKWKLWLPLAEFWYNTTYHTSLGCSPFKVVYGYDPPVAAAPSLLLPESGGNGVVPAIDMAVQDLLLSRERHLELLKVQLARAQNRMKQKADRSRTEREFQVGELVLLKLQPYVQHSVVFRSCPKLAFRYFGPYKVLQRIGQVAYKLDLPPDSKIHPVFHVSQLKSFSPNHCPVLSELPTTLSLDQGVLKPVRILDRRLVRKRESGCSSSADPVD